ncbi:hypothetical protein EB796_021981 [Bugula neritina]|uniref:Uncharacterized protein n=1 Tax=Bugula neritina TaxID=10212 RepID=A0A7J7J0W4_BUGNE|nr:hypothetical protein EB796_021981 [Bugula neritina]
MLITFDKSFKDSLTGTMKERGKHSFWKLALIIAHGVVFVGVLVINYLSSSNVGVSSGLYKSSTGDVADKYEILISPAGWTFTIWAVIYIWQFIHIIYSFTLICRKNKQGEYLYNANPSHIHFSFYIIYIINNCVNIAWIFVFDRELLVASTVVLFVIAISLYICGIIICKYLDHAAANLESSDLGKDIWMTRIFTLNGIGIYGTWTTIASLLNLAISLQHVAEVHPVTCAWVALGILTGELVIWFVMETFFFDRYLRYLFTPYVVLVVAFSGVLSKQLDPSNPAPYLIYIIVLLSITVVLGLIKVLVMFVRGQRQPITYFTSV